MNKKLLYLAPTILYKVRANTIQSLCQYYYLSNKFQKTHYVSLTPLGKKELKKLISDASNLKTIPLGIFEINNIFKIFSRDIFNSIYQLLICIKFFFNSKFTKKTNLYIYSRSLIASYFLSLTNIKQTYEIHNIENNKILRFMQKKVVESRFVSKVFISKKLKKLTLIEYKLFNIDNILIAPDSSPEYDLNDKSLYRVTYLLKNFLKNENEIKCIYAGSAGEGRGVELIINIARVLQKVKFIIVGEFKKSDFIEIPNNIFFVGKVSHQETLKLMSMADVGLMPYQKRLQMGKFKLNSISWMSPLKMFDYMNSGLLIIASYHSVLEEILEDNNTCYFIKNYQKNIEWVNTIKKINKDDLEKISFNSKNLFEKKYNYKVRTELIIKILNKV